MMQSPKSPSSPTRPRTPGASAMAAKSPTSTKAPSSAGPTVSSSGQRGMGGTSPSPQSGDANAPQHVMSVPKPSTGVVHISAEKLDRMRQEARELLLKDEDTADAIDAVCEANGWSRDTFINNRHQITYIELFMLQFPQISLIRHFPNVVHVKLMHVGLKELDARDFANLPHLEVLWLSENDLTAVRNGGLKCCKKLRELYIYTNNLPSLDPFLDLPELEVLNISNNRIASLDGIGTLPNLKSLCIANNLITTIVGKLDNNKALEELNLAGNKIASLREIPCLNLLPRLQKLYFADPVFGDNPVSLLSNYQTFTLSHVHAVTYLDYIFISPEQRLIAETTFTKKKVFYSMRLQSLSRNFNMLCNEVQFAINEKSSDAEKSLAQLVNAQRDLEAVLEEAATVDGFVPEFKEGKTIEEAQAAMAAVESAIQGRRVEVTEMAKRGNQCVEEMASVLERTRSKILLDLSSGGNVQLEDGRMKDLWFQSCAELLRTRFFASDYASLNGVGITDVKASRVTRIHNRSLRATFDRALGSMVDVGDPRYKAALEYLFFAEPLQSSPANTDENNYLNRIIEYGFKGHIHGSQEASPGSIPMTNSLFLADQVRLMDSVKSGEYRTSPSTYTSRIVVSKVFLGRCVQERGPPGAASMALDTTVPLLRAGKPVDRRDYPKDVLSVYRSRPDDPKQRIWHCFDNTLVLPEYIVELTYSTSAVSAPRPALSEWPQNRSEEAVQSLRKMFPNASQADIADFRPMAPYFLAFANWVTSGGGMGAVAAKEAQEALAAAPIPAKSKPPLLDGVLTATAINAELLVGRSRNPISFRFHGRAIKHLFAAAPDSASCRRSIEMFIETSATSLVPRLANVTVVDLSKNSLRMSSVSEWAILAMSLPAVEKFNVSYNQILFIPSHPSVESSRESNEVEIKKLVGKTQFAHVKELNLSKNAVEVIEGFANLGDWFPAVHTLDTRFNPAYHDPIEAARVNAFVCLQSGLRSLAVLNGAPVDSALGGTRPSAIKHMKSQPTALTASLTAAILRVVGRSCLTVTSSGGLVDVGPNGRTMPDESFYGILSPACNSIDPLNMRPAFDAAKEAVLKASERLATLVVPGVQATYPKWNDVMVGSGSDDIKEDTNLVNQCAVLSFNGALLTSLPATLVPRVANTLVHLQLQDHYISSIDSDVIRQLVNLESLDLRGNRITTIPPASIGTLRQLKRLDLGRNLLENVDGLFELDDESPLSDEEAATGVLPNLTFIAVDGNRLPTLVPFGILPNLQELYVSNNLIQDERQLNLLRDMPRLIILDLTLNPCCRHDLYRPYAIFHLKRLKVLDGQAIDTDEAQYARNTFAGRVSAELLNERIAPETDWSRITVLNLASCALKEIILLESFKSLLHLRLEHNSLSSVSGLETCSKLLTLNLAHNRLTDSPIGTVLASMTSLESLSLESNQITAVETLQLRLPRLKFLNVKSNEITKLGGLNHLSSLRELVLDRNKLRGLDRAALVSVAQLREIHCNDNAIKSLEGIQVLQYLVKATFVANRLGDIQDTFRCLQDMPIVTLILLGNAVTRKPSYRSGLINAMSCLQSLDERSVSMEERERVEATFNPDATPPNVLTDVRMNIVGGGMFVSPVIPSPVTQQQQQQQPSLAQRQAGVRSVTLGEAQSMGDAMAVVGRSEGVGMPAGRGVGGRGIGRTSSADRGASNNVVASGGYRSTRPMLNILPSASVAPVRATRRQM